jgi:gas vesicle protein
MESERERNAWSFATGLLLGGVIGAGVAMLTAPRAGRRTRRRIRRSARRIRGSASHRLDDLATELKDKVDEAVGVAREHLGD